MMFRRQAYNTPVNSRGPTPPPPSPAFGVIPQHGPAPSLLGRALEAHRSTLIFPRPFAAQATANTMDNTPQNYGLQLHGLARPTSYNSTHPTYEQQSNINRTRSITRQSASLGLNREYVSQQVLDRDHAYLQQQLYQMGQTISRLPGLPPHVVAALAEELRKLSRDYISRSRSLSLSHDNLLHQKEDLERLVLEKQRLIQNAITERDRASGERDRIQRQYNELAARQRLMEQRHAENEKNYLTTVEKLENEIQFKEEQVNGKRSLWVNNHPSSTVKRARDPFNTPSALRRSGRGHDFSPRDVKTPTNLTEAFETLYIDPNSPSMSEAPTGLGPPAPYHHYELSHIRTHAEGLRLEDAVPSTAMVPFKTDDQIAAEYGKQFEKLYRLADGWVQTHAKTVPDLSFDQHLANDTGTWLYILKCSFEDLTQAQVHVIALLRDDISRPMVVLRVIVQYINDYIWTSKAFKGKDTSIDEKLDYIEEHLETKGKGLSPEDRARLVDWRTNIMQQLVQQDDYLAFRTICLASHTKALRQLTGCLLDVEAARSMAGRDIGVIVVNAFDLAAEMLTANQTFVISFPEVQSRFQHASMICQDPQINEPSLQLQLRHARVKLCITPVITMRDDRNMTIKVKMVQHSHVLIMD